MIAKRLPTSSFLAKNWQGQPAIYITNDPTLNTLTLSFTNKTGADMRLRGGKPMPEPEITSDSPTSFYLTFGWLLNIDQFCDLQITRKHWQARCFRDSVVNWLLVPQRNVVLQDGDHVEFAISNIIATGQPRQGYLTVDYYNVPSVNDDSIQILLQLQHAPAV